MFLTPGSRANRKRVAATSGGGGGTPAAPSGSVQFNNAGSFGAFGLWDGSATLSIVNLATAEAFRVYNTTDSNSSPVNYERGVFDWTTTANVLTIGTQKGGTGSTRNIQFVVGGTNALDYAITSVGAWNITGAGLTIPPNQAFNLASGGAAGAALFGQNNSLLIVPAQNGNNTFSLTKSGTNYWVAFESDAIVGFAPTTNASGAQPDTGFHRNAAAVFYINKGASATPTGSLSTAVWQQHHDAYGAL